MNGDKFSRKASFVWKIGAHRKNRGVNRWKKNMGKHRYEKIKVSLEKTVLKQLKMLLGK
jgi:hypothetical protein